MTFIKKNVVYLLILFSLTALMSVLYYFEVIDPRLDNLPKWFKKIINSDVGSPYNYRLLVPFLFQGFDSYLNLPQKYSYFIITFLIFLFSNLCLGLAIATSFKSDSGKYTALLYAAFFIIISMPAGGIHLWSYIDIGLYSLSYFFISRNFGIVSYSVLTFVAILNRETGVLLALVPFFLKSFRTSYNFKLSLFKNEIFIIAFAVLTFISIRVLQGSSESVLSVSEVFSKNFTPAILITSIMVYMGVFSWFLIGKIDLLEIEKAYIFILVINSVLILFFGLFREIRMFLPYTFLFSILLSKKIRSMH
mgnify:CR=1 FL=1|tara:strand:+ start:408 stop:1325 length:918 start_codon:yes stop_codon:yes gene_type:complete